MNKIAELHGCECSGTEMCNVHTIQGYNAENAPIYRTVDRNGKQMNVCSRCDLSTDSIVKTFDNSEEQCTYDILTM